MGDQFLQNSSSQILVSDTPSAVIMGFYNHHESVNKSLHVVPCSDMCGTVVRLGSSVRSSWQVGDRVLSTFNQTHLTGQITAKKMVSGLCLPLPGVLTQYRVFPAYGLVKAPVYLTDKEACTLPIAAVTAWMEGETVLVQGTGGVSICGLQIAKASGSNIIVTSSSDAKLERARALGVDHTINYRTQSECQNEVMRLTSDHGADIIFETGGALTLKRSFDCVAFGGLINCIGYLSCKKDAPGDRTNANALALRRNVTLKGILNEPKDRFEEMLAVYEKHGIHPVVDKVFAFEESKEALQYLYKGGHFGKVVIKVVDQ
ncbi:alcohol dehydrogenase [Cryomyces antarcticus]